MFAITLSALRSLLKFEVVVLLGGKFSQGRPVSKGEQPIGRLHEIDSLVSQFATSSAAAR